MRIRRYGWDSLLLEVDDPAAWFLALRKARDKGDLVCQEIVPAARTVLLRGVERTPPLESIDAVSASGLESAEVTVVTLVTVPVVWDGEDVADVAATWGVDPAGLLRQTHFTVAFCGFAPGFAYLTGLPGRFEIPRLETPRTTVPAGSVAVAGTYAGIYPRASPGGWRLLGRTELTLFDLERDPPSLLTPATVVRFVDA